MTSKGYALAREQLIRALTAYTGITTSDGLANGTTLIDSNLIGKDSQKIVEKTILIMSGDADWEDKGASSFDTGSGKITLQGTGFSAQIKAGTIFRILNISSVEIDVEAINTKIGTDADAAGTTTLFAWLAKIFAAEAVVQAAVSDGAPAVTDFDTDLTEASNDHYNGMLMMFLDGNLAGQAHLIDDYVGATKNVIFAASDQWTEAPANGDSFVIIPSPGAYLKKIYDKLVAVQAGTETLESLDDELDAMLDLAGGDSETEVMTGGADVLYTESAGTSIRSFYGLFIDWTGLNFGGGEDTTVEVQLKFGANWRTVWSEVFLAAALPSPIVTPIPRQKTDNLQLPPIMYKQGVRVLATQAAIGAGWNTLTYFHIDAAPGA